MPTSSTLPGCDPHKFSGIGIFLDLGLVKTRIIVYNGIRNKL